MNEGSLDRILAKIEQRHQRVTAKVENRLKGTKPFASVKLEPEEILYHVNQLSQQDWDGFAMEFGVDRVMTFLNEVQKIKLRRQ